MKKKIFAMIPARIGSQRLKLKNLSLLNGKPFKTRFGEWTGFSP